MSAARQATPAGRAGWVRLAASAAPAMARRASPAGRAAAPAASGRARPRPAPSCQPASLPTSPPPPTAAAAGAAHRAARRLPELRPELRGRGALHCARADSRRVCEVGGVPGGVVWCSVVRCGVASCGVVWCAVPGCGVVWRVGQLGRPSAALPGPPRRQPAPPTSPPPPALPPLPVRPQACCGGDVCAAPGARQRGGDGGLRGHVHAGGGGQGARAGGGCGEEGGAGGPLWVCCVGLCGWVGLWVGGVGGWAGDREGMTQVGCVGGWLAAAGSGGLREGQAVVPAHLPATPPTPPAPPDTRTRTSARRLASRRWPRAARCPPSLPAGASSTRPPSSRASPQPCACGRRRCLGQ